MAEKRFKMNVIEEELYPMPVYYDNGEEIGYDKIVDLLNNFNEETIKLNGAVAHYKLVLMSLEEAAKRITENGKVRK